MTTTRRASAWAVAGMLLVAGSSVSLAQSRPYGDEQYRAPQMQAQAPNNPYSDYPAPEVQAVPAARARAAIAKMEHLRAQADLNRGTRAVVRTFNKSEDMNKAMAEENAAYAEYQAARDRALQPLDSDDRYQALKALRKKLGEQIAAKHAEHKDVSEELLALAGVKLNYSTSLTLREAALLRSSNEVNDAKRRLVAATGRIADLRARFADDVRDDPDLIASRRNVFDARVALVAAQSYLAGVKEARGIALDYAYYTRRHNPYRVMGYDPYGFNPYYYAYGNGYRY